MTTDTEQTSATEIDEALATMRKMYGNSNDGFGKNPRWVYDGFDAVDRVHERAAQELGNSYLQELAVFIGPADSGTSAAVVNRLLFIQQIGAAHLVNKLLRSRGIDPASL